MDAIALVGLVVLMAGFGIAATHVAQSRARDGKRRDHGDGGPGVFSTDAGSDQGSCDAGDGGGGGGGDAGGCDGGGGGDAT